MSAKGTLKRNKPDIVSTLTGDYLFILNKVSAKDLITQREYNNLKSINNVNVEGHVVELVDKIVNKGEDTCKEFLNLLQADEEVQTTFPEMKYKLNDTGPLLQPIPCSDDGAVSQGNKKEKDELYQIKSHPVGLCLIINNEIFTGSQMRRGTNKDADYLAKVFSWLGFKVLMCKDQTQDHMDRTLKCFATLSNVSQLQEFKVMEWSDTEFIDLQQAPKHGDAFVCCILSHGELGSVLGVDLKPLSIKQITRNFKATDESPLTSKPKLFFIQACQGNKTHRGVSLKDLEADCSGSSIPEEADVLVTTATIEDYVSFRHPKYGSWFVQSLCEQLEEGCPKKEEIQSILLRVNNQVSQKEASERKQMPEVRHTLRKKLVLSPKPTS
ncbi:caspase-8-like [Echeneis naucrates]|uniref:Caspase-8-like n=1 Tax=Echeneis naucrates TaxID=173247 RepID=A0A665U1B6_ECHNA|nr:caspase-8-like [Echeneis naucrates]